MKGNLPLELERPQTECGNTRRGLTIRLIQQGRAAVKGTRKSTEERFWEKVDKTDPAGCWEWQAAKTLGYGVFYFQGNGSFRAHRYSYMQAFGTIPEGMQIDHICRNRACVNPDHLRLATNKQNNENMSGPKRNNKSGYRGVWWHEEGHKWAATVRHNKKNIYLGLFDDVLEAARVAADKRRELFTHNELDRKVTDE